ncbi:MAG: hypothetical protein Q8M29_10275 [Bacteroidota bacterium]|nr:hypothetical protein [Bacteroidota bacterium]
MKKITTALCLITLITVVIFACKKEDKTTTTSSTTTSGTTTTASGTTTSGTTTSGTTTSGTTTGGLSASTPLQVTYTLDGTNYTYTDGSNFEMAANGSAISFTGSTGTANYKAYFVNNLSGNIHFYLEKGSLIFNGTSGIAPNSNFDSFFPNGSVPYGSITGNGLDLFVDVGGFVFRSENGSQAGSTFAITDTLTQNISGTHYVKFKATFACKVYDSNGQNMKTITNGLVVGRFKNM